MAVDKYVGFVDVGSGDSLPIGSTLYGTCDTAGSTAAKVVNCAAFDRLETGVTIHVKFSYENTNNSPTLNVNGTGAIAIKKNSYAEKDIGIGVHSFTYDGSSWQIDSTAHNNKVTSFKSTTNDNYPIIISDQNASAWGSATQRTSTVSLNPDIYANPSTGYFTAAKFSSDGSNYYEIGAAAEKAIGSVASGNTGLVTGDAVYQALQGITPSVTGDLIYKGAVSAASSLLNVAMMQGYTYIASAEFTITDSSSVAHTIQSGDLIIINTDGTYTTQAGLWAAIDVIQSNLDKLTTSDIDAAIAEAEAA